MAKWVHLDVLDGGLNAIKNGATKMLLINNYAAGDSYATVTGNAVATATMTPADFTLATAGGARTLTSAIKSTTATANSVAADHHIAFTDGVGKVMWVTDEPGEASAEVGDTVIFPASVYTAQQPI